jgi:hypothetical protein
MKNLIKLILILIFYGAIIKGQVLNNDFEEWVGETPTNWQTSNVTLIALPISKTTESHSGSFAAKGEVINSITGDELFLPVLTSIPTPEAFPVPRMISTVSMYYKFNSIGGDKLAINVMCFAGNDFVGSGGKVIESSNSAFSLITIPIEYVFPGIPNKCIIIIGAGHDDEEIGGHVGTYFIVDDISFDGITDVENELVNQPNQFILEQNFPNPFNPSTVINYNLIANDFINLSVYDILGNKVAELVNENKSAGNYSVKFDASDLSSGIYLYKLSSKNFTQTNKMMLVK